ncbi:MAG: universal stress protein [Polyangiales bacterium]
MAAKHILVGTDLSESSKHAVESTAEYARAHGSRVSVVHVIDSRAFLPPQAVLRPETEAERLDGAKVALDGLRASLLFGLDSEAVVLMDHSAARAICDFAKENDVDAIAVGSQGYGRVEKWLIGSVAERIVRHAHCTVFVFR